MAMPLLNNCHNIEWFPGDTCLICEHIKADRNQIADHLAKDLEQYIHDRKHFNQTLPWVRTMPFIIDRIRRGTY